MFYCCVQARLSAPSFVQARLLGATNSREFYDLAINRFEPRTERETAPVVARARRVFSGSGLIGSSEMTRDAGSSQSLVMID